VLSTKAKKHSRAIESPANFKHWLLLILIASIWGSSFILIKHGLFGSDGAELFTPLQVGGMRIVMAALFMVPIVARKTGVLKNGKLKYLLAVGIFGNGIPAFLFAMAQTEIPSALAGMLNSLVPVFSMLIALAVFGVKIRFLQVVGVAVGLASAVGLILSSGGFQGAEIDPLYALLVVLATVCYAISLNVIKQFLQEESSVAITGMALILVSPAGVAILLGSDFFTRVTEYPDALPGLGAIAILAIIGTALALIFFNRLVQETNTVFAASVTYLIPLVAILWGLADGENLNWFQAGCGLTMLGGIFLINRG
jgi:drug/metabolite transporter (DMT)-like permease